MSGEVKQAQPQPQQQQGSIVGVFGQMVQMLQSLQTEVSELRSELQSSGALTQQRDEIEKLKAEREILTNQIDSLTEDRAVISNQVHKLSEEKAEAEQTIANLKQEIELFRESNQNILRMIDENRDKYNSAYETIQQAEALKADLAELQQLKTMMGVTSPIAPTEEPTQDYGLDDIEDDAAEVEVVEDEGFDLDSIEAEAETEDADGFDLDSLGE